MHYLQQRSDRKHQLWSVSRVPFNQKQMSHPVSFYQQRRRARCAVRAAVRSAHACISLRQQYDSAPVAIELIRRRR